ncbi:MAG: Hsp20 family protein [Clostridium sp.]|uniref:Hsp20 family protein n=1 Tax=Clostridium sp. TaxID=1506 RepID=UPI003F3C344C
MNNNNLSNNNGFFSSIFNFTNLINDSGIIDNILNEMLSEDNNNSNINVAMREEDDAYIIEGIFNGVKRKDLKIDYKDDYVYLNVNNAQTFSNGSYGNMVIMQYGGDYRREFYLPNSDGTRIEASYKNYQLNLKIPKIIDNFIEGESNIIDVEEFYEE